MLMSKNPLMARTDKGTMHIESVVTPVRKNAVRPFLLQASAFFLCRIEDYLTLMSILPLLQQPGRLEKAFPVPFIPYFRQQRRRNGNACFGLLCFCRSRPA
jgi:hypothetical protein